MMARIMVWTMAAVFSAVAAYADVSGFRPKIACVPFMATSLQAMAFTESISVTMLNNIDRSNAFEVVERKKTEHYLEMEGLRLDNLTQDGLLRIGRKAGVDYIIYGSVGSAGPGVELHANLLNVRSGRLALQERLRISENDFSRVMAELSARVVDWVRNTDRVAVSTAKAIKINGKAPANLSASGTPNSVRLVWDYSDAKSVAGFNIYRSANINGPYHQHATTVAPAYVDENLGLNEVFYYKVAAVSLDGRACDMTAPVRGATAIAPLAPILMNVTTGIKSGRLAWRPRHCAGSDSRMVPAGFRVYRGQGEHGALKPIARLTLDALQFNDAGLADGQKYCYVVTSFNADNAESDNSSRLCDTTLAAPQGLKGISAKIRQVPLSWQRYAGAAEGYVLYQSDSSDGKYARLVRIDSLDSTTFLAQKLADGAEYWYRISALGPGGVETDPSAPVRAVTRNIPPAPRNLAAVGGLPRRVMLKWQSAAAAEDEIRQVLIYRSAGGRNDGYERIAEIPGDSSEYLGDRTPLADRATYHYRIAVQNSGNAVSRFSETVSAVTKPVPAVPSNLKAVSGEQKRVRLNWDKNPEADIKHYSIYRKRSGDQDFEHVHDTTGNSFLDSGLPDGAEVSYRLQAMDRDGLTSPLSAPVSARTKPLPARVSGLRVMDAAKRIISWQPGSEKEVRSYVIYRKGFLGVAEKLATVGQTTWQAGGDKGRLELFVTAVDESGLESEASQTIVLE
ncbi:MAG TPA: hypothetical protein PLN25_03480 [Deltaproteobacteria bacterium]|nr:hypothetical protein [Deltaproteobacteria bacterium]